MDLWSFVLVLISLSGKEPDVYSQRESPQRGRTRGWDFWLSSALAIPNPFGNFI
jgi:hypothetical protein